MLQKNKKQNTLATGLGIQNVIALIYIAFASGFSLPAIMKLFGQNMLLSMAFYFLITPAVNYYVSRPKTIKPELKGIEDALYILDLKLSEENPRKVLSNLKSHNLRKFAEGDRDYIVTKTSSIDDGVIVYRDGTLQFISRWFTVKNRWQRDCRKEIDALAKALNTYQKTKEGANNGTNGSGKEQHSTRSPLP